MAEFSKIIPTDNGRAMMADVIAGATMEFTKMVLSDTVYTEDELYSLTDIADIKQESWISAIYVTGSTAVRVSCGFTNEGLTEGYTIRSVGLYAKETGGDEILYAAAIETTGTYDMPAQTGTTVSSAYMQWVVSVGDSENVSVEISSNAYALAVDVNERFEEIELKMDEYVKIDDIVDNCTTTSTDKPLSANQGKVLYDLYQNIDQSLSGDFAPINHATSATTYGIGTSSLYGHLKISDNYTSSAGAASAGVAASSQAVYNTYNSLLSKFTDGSVSKVGTSSVGSGTKPIYLSSGTPTASSSTVGSGTQPVYMSSGTITACGTTVGSGTKPIYSASGVLTVSGSTVGGSAQPMYLNGGTMTACSSTVGSGTRPVYMNGGTITALGTTVGSSTQPIYSNGGTLTACSNGWSTATVTWASNVNVNGGRVMYNSLAKLAIAYIDISFSSMTSDWNTVCTFSGCTANSYYGGMLPISAETSRTSSAYARRIAVEGNTISVSGYSADAGYQFLFTIPFSIS